MFPAAFTHAALAVLVSFVPCIAEGPARPADGATQEKKQPEKPTVNQEPKPTAARTAAEVEAARERGRLELRAILTAAGARADVPGGWDNFLLWRDVLGVRYDGLEVYSTRVQGRTEPWRTNHLLPRFFFANGIGRGYMLQELVAQASAEGDLRPQFKREIGAGDTYWYEVDGQFLRDHEGTIAAQKSFLGEYFYGFFPHSLVLFEPEMVWLRNERIRDRALEVYRLSVSAPFVAQYGHFAQYFNAYVDPATHRIEQLQFVDPYADDVTVVVRYSDWIRVAVPKEQRDAWLLRLASEVDDLRETIGDDAAAKLAKHFMTDPRVVPQHIVMPSRRIVFDSRGGREREFLAADFHIETLPPESIELPWQVGRSYTSPYRSDFFDPPKDGSKDSDDESTGDADEPAQRDPRDGDGSANESKDR